MRRVSFVLPLALCATFANPATSSAQFVRPMRTEPRAWLVISDGFGPTGGGVSNTTGFSHLFRASGTLRITNSIGTEFSALRIQELLPSTKLIGNTSLSTPRADGLFASIAQLNSDGSRGGFPSTATLGGGVVQRPTNDPTKKRLTGAVMGGVEGDLWRPSASWWDTTAGIRFVLMPAGNRHEIYMVALTLGLRAG